LVFDILILIIGGTILYLGAEWFVKGSERLAYALGIKPIVIGLTVVAYGTSAPEAIVTLFSAAQGYPGMALSNIIGSNIANIGLIFGLTALICPFPVEAGLIRREIPIMLMATFAVPLILINGYISRLEGGFLLLGAIGFTYIALKLSSKLSKKTILSKQAEETLQLKKKNIKLTKFVFLIIIGLVFLVVGGKLFVGGASSLASSLGVSDRLIGLTILALGTSLPELATSLVAAIRGYAELAIGNIIGSNILNIFFVLGATALIVPLKESITQNYVSLIVLIGLTITVSFFLRKKRTVTRYEGFILCISYFSFIAGMIIMQ